LALAISTPERIRSTGSRARHTVPLHTLPGLSISAREQGLLKQFETSSEAGGSGPGGCDQPPTWSRWAPPRAETSQPETLCQYRRLLLFQALHKGDNDDFSFCSPGSCPYVDQPCPQFR